MPKTSRATSHALVMSTTGSPVSSPSRKRNVDPPVSTISLMTEVVMISRRSRCAPSWSANRSRSGIGKYSASVDADALIAVVLEARKLMERATRWLLMNRRSPFGIAETVSFLAEGVGTVRSAIPKLLSGRDMAGFQERRASFTSQGVPAGLADEVAAMVPSYSAFDIVTSAAATRHGVEETAAVYFLLADRLQLGRLRDLIVALPRDDRWSSVARSALRDDLYAAHAALTRDVLTIGASDAGLTGAWAVTGPSGGAADRIATWEAQNVSAVSRAAATLAEIWESNRFSFTTLAVAVRVIRTLVAPGS